MDRNLGGSQAATGSMDFLAYGSLYQWGRGGDGHQCINWTSATGSDGTEQNRETTTLATTAAPNDGNVWDGLFITAGSSPFDWLSTQDDNLWQEVSGINNPCPSGYRVPTEVEWNNERDSWDGVLDMMFSPATNNATGAIASPLKLPLSGGRNPTNGLLGLVGISGDYWTSTVSDSNARRIGFNNVNANMGNSNRATGLSVRCLKE
jgi:uncharacterized protein (TIGR02145 family)